jgi:hypothetical protein
MRGRKECRKGLNKGGRGTTSCHHTNSTPHPQPSNTIIRTDAGEFASSRNEDREGKLFVRLICSRWAWSGL